MKGVNISWVGCTKYSKHENSGGGGSLIIVTTVAHIYQYSLDLCKTWHGPDTTNICLVVLRSLYNPWYLYFSQIGEFSWGDASRAPGSQLFAQNKHQHSNMVRERGGGGGERMFNRNLASDWPPSSISLSLAKTTVRFAMTCRDIDGISELPFI